MFAIVEIAGKQFKVAQGHNLEVPLMKDKKAGDKMTFDTVLLKSDGTSTEIGTPHVKGSSVELKIVEHGKGDKIRVYKKKAKKRFEKTQGHRQGYTKVEIVAVK